MVLVGTDFDSFQKSIAKNNKTFTPLYNIFLAGKGPWNTRFILSSAQKSAWDLLNLINQKSNKPSQGDIAEQLRQIIIRLGDTSNF